MANWYNGVLKYVKTMGYQWLLNKLPVRARSAMDTQR